MEFKSLFFPSKEERTPIQGEWRQLDPAHYVRETRHRDRETLAKAVRSPGTSGITIPNDLMTAQAPEASAKTGWLKPQYFDIHYMDGDAEARQHEIDDHVLGAGKGHEHGADAFGFYRGVFPKDEPRELPPLPPALMVVKEQP